MTPRQVQIKLAELNKQLVEESLQAYLSAGGTVDKLDETDPRRRLFEEQNEIEKDEANEKELDELAEKAFEDLKTKGVREMFKTASVIK